MRTNDETRGKATASCEQAQADDAASVRRKKVIEEATEAPDDLALWPGSPAGDMLIVVHGCRKGLRLEA